MTLTFDIDLVRQTHNQVGEIEMSKFSMAYARGSESGKLLVNRADSPLTPLTLAPKKTSGLVQAATARRI